jgi:hypothetical protein
MLLKTLGLEVLSLDLEVSSRRALDLGRWNRFKGLWIVCCAVGDWRGGEICAGISRQRGHSCTLGGARAFYFKELPRTRTFSLENRARRAFDHFKVSARWETQERRAVAAGVGEKMRF